jgi:hypothetical protein
MKKLLFLPLVVGMLLALNVGVSAQRGYINSVVTKSSSGKLTPVAGDEISLIVAYADRDVPDVGIKKGNKICVMNVRRGTEFASVFSGAECGTMKFTKPVHKITYVHNPDNAALQKNDKAVIDPGTRSISFSRGSSAVLTLFYEN